MMHSAASGLGLHCLPMSHKKDARLNIWVIGDGNPDDYYDLYERT